ncbi:GMC family oxidoreductase [Streptomyces sp. PT12]|uniref:GMC family oxidoreductase n=1 Tax=Streptomyces sp. PT12 TaxID=1510197 RepID=UPI000DE2C1BF|nr:GMC family oxidoreductase N-terminal domain-containing protein [Streptomyces sp. PT12]RBM10035.1 glucose-methanol-choline oxidoreductase [Streptomyces sp. PT12]
MNSAGPDVADPYELVTAVSASFSEPVPTDVDVVIVGGGPAGSVLASRLSANPRRQVLLLEAGDTTGAEPASQVPGLAFGLLTGRNAWPDMTEPQPALHDRRIYLAQGRGLGGGSSMNMMAWFRGHPEDFTGWVKAGATGWGWDDVVGTFDAIEEREPRAGRTGRGGVIAVTPARDVSALPLTFLAGAKAAGMPISTDFNGDVREGAGLFASNIREGRRDSVVSAYLASALHRPNWHVRTGVTASKILLEQGHATGVLAQTPTGTVDITAAKVIVTAGAIRTPQLLMLSGIGERAHLHDRGISPVIDLPGVGQNLQDHPMITPVWSVIDDSPLANTIGEAEQTAYALARRGPLATMSQAGAIFRTDPNLVAPDVQMTLTLLALDDAGQIRSDPVITAALSVLAPTSRGTVSLRLDDPAGQPVINPRYLTTDQDMAALRAGLRHIERVFRAGPLTTAIGDALSITDFSDDDELDSFIRGNATTEWHPCGTCRMGTDPDAVVDPETLLVHGTDNLHIADSSIMPTVTRGNTQAPVIMIAERASTRI